VKQLWQLLSVGIVLLLAWPVQAAFEPLKHVPPGTVAIARVDLAALRASPLVKDYSARQPERIKGMNELVLQQTGVDPEQVQQAWLFAQDGSRGMAAITGSFPATAVRDRLAQNPAMTQTALEGTVFAFSFTPARNQVARVCALVDEQLLIVGDTPTLTAFLASVKGTTGTTAETLPAAKLARLTGSTAVLSAVVTEIRPEWRQAMPLVMNLVGDAALTADVNTAIALQVLLVPQKPELGQPLEDLLRGVLNAQLAQAQQATANGAPTPRGVAASSLLERVTIGREGDNVTVSFKVDPNELPGATPAAAAPAPAAPAAP
jgi:hypothetical protein